MPHQRSPQAYADSLSREKKRELIHQIVRDHSFHDWIIGEIVYTQEHANKCVDLWFKLLFGEGKPIISSRYKYGDVLNRSPILPHFEDIYYHYRGVFQR